ncbi:MAG: peptide-methionine (S)-S-oxide reductase MsrA [Bacteroidota bacterium]
MIQMTLSLLMLIGVNACTPSQPSAPIDMQTKNLDGLSKAYLASGCFWCVEAIYESLIGVEEVISGYAGGTTDDPTYRKVGSGKTGHAEAVEIYYDSTKISFETLIDVYYASQDPTTYGQKPDFGSAYRSIIFYQNESELSIAEEAKATVAASIDKEVVTEIKEFEVFYPAEDYHQDYEKRNPNQPYVRGVSIPRLKRFQAKMPELVRKDH